MATITELVTSCLTASAEAAQPSIGVNVVSTIAATVALSTAIGYNAVSNLNATSTPTPSAVITELMVSTIASAGDGSHPYDELVTSHTAITGTPADSAHTGEAPVSGGAITGTPTTQLQATTLAVSSAKVTSRAILDQAPVTLWVNTKTMAAAVWEGLAVDAYAVFQDQLMASGDNLVTFGADKDAGAAINVRIIDDWRHYGGETMREARFVSAYLSAVAAAPMRIGVETDLNGAYQYDTHLASSVRFVNHRAVFGRGLRGEYARLSFINVNGADFDVAALAVYAFERPRHIGG